MVSRTTLFNVVVGAATAALVAGPMLPSAVASPARTGTIVGGLGFQPAKHCWEAPDCSPWLLSGCPALAQADPALETSIVDVRALADGQTRRRMNLERSAPWGNVAGGVIVEFWRASCAKIPRALAFNRPTRFVVPRGATWMTVVASDNEFIRWSYA